MANKSAAELFELERFKAAQDTIYHRVVSELEVGRKQSHWMWFIFPQIKGLGHSYIAQEYAIHSIEEACAYLADPLLGGRLKECCQLLMDVEGKSALEVLGSPDDLKLRSSITLFILACNHGNLDKSIFTNVLEKYYQGEMDPLTLSQLA